MAKNIEDYREYCLSLGADVEEKLPFTAFRYVSNVLVFYVCGHMFAFLDIDHYGIVTLKCQLANAAPSPSISSGFDPDIGSADICPRCPVPASFASGRITSLTQSMSALRNAPSANCCVSVAAVLP
jgi:hypothetical protein